MALLLLASTYGCKCAVQSSATTRRLYCGQVVPAQAVRRETSTYQCEVSQQQSL